MIEKILKKIKIATNYKKIEFGLIIGSGLSDLVPQKKILSIPYNEIPNFPKTKISSHSGTLDIVVISGKNVAVLNGRCHFYENGDSSLMYNPINILKRMGIKKMIITNSAGSLKKKMFPGSIMIIKDHINLTGQNPLIGFGNDEVFVDMVNAYDKKLIKSFIKTAKKENIKVHSGVYTWFSGPSFETPAEINLLKKVGSNAVGMSTVPEVIICRYLKIRVLGISVITNFAAGLSKKEISHEQTKLIAPKGGNKIKKVLNSFLRENQ